MSMPFHGKRFKFRQPDGKEIELRGFGDQHHAVFETLDGFTVTRNPAHGGWEVARLSDDRDSLQPAAVAGALLDGLKAGVARGLRIRREAALARGRESALRVAGRRCQQRFEARRQEQRTLRAIASAGGPLLAPPRRETVGEYLGLCLLIDFSDAPATITRDEVDRFCNLAGYSGFGNRGSVRDYFLANSIGRCSYRNVVLPYYRARKPKSYYTDRTIPQPVRAIELINEALAHWKAQGTDFTQLTADPQGFVYATNVYYSGPVVNEWSEGLWPHAHHLNSAVALAAGRSAFDYQFSAMGSELALGTFCHENGHMLCDYPDLYDYGDESSGVGAYCLMCAGANIDEKNPVQIGAYLKRLSGWARSTTPLAHGATVTLAADVNDFALHSRGGREYFLIENRRRAGRDAALPDEGLAIWHVDEEGDNSHEQMTGASHYECSLEQADGRFDLERQRGAMGDGADLYAGAAARFDDRSVPDSRWWNGTPSNLAIDQVSAAGASVTFRCLLGDAVAPPPGTLRRDSSPKLAIPDHPMAGVSDSIAIADAGAIASIKVGVEITHTFIGDLRVTLVAPWGTVIELKPKGDGGSGDDWKVVLDEATRPALATLRGRSMQGTWKLVVQDLAAADVGKLDHWWLELTAAAAVPTSPVVLQESPGTAIPDSPATGIERSLVTAEAGKASSVELAIDLSHSYVGDLRVRLRAPSGKEALLHDRAGGSSDNLALTWTAANAPALAGLVGEPIAGTWKLLISDHAAIDVGKLNRWSLTLRRAAGAAQTAIA